MQAVFIDTGVRHLFLFKAPMPGLLLVRPELSNQVSRPGNRSESHGGTDAMGSLGFGVEPMGYDRLCEGLFLAFRVLMVIGV